MTRALAILVTLIFLVLASYVFISMRPVALPKALDPVANWFEERRGGAVDSSEPPSSTASATPATQTIAGRSSVAEVSVDQAGKVSIKPDDPPVAQSQGVASSASPSTTRGTGTPTTVAKAPSQVTGSAASAGASAAKAVDNAAEKTNDNTATQAAATARTTADLATANVSSAAPVITDQKPVTSPALSPVPAGKLAKAEAVAANDVNTSSRVLGQTEEDWRSAKSPQNSGTRDAAATATDALAAKAVRATQRAKSVVTRPSTPSAPKGVSTDTENQALVANNAVATASGASPKSEQAQLAMAQPAVPAVPNVAADPALIPPAVTTPPPRTVEAVEQQRTIVNFLEGKVVEFEVGRDRLTVAGIRVLDRLVPIIKKHEDTMITVQGHTDDIGDSRSNLELSAARAIAARRYLISQGVAPERLRAQGLGERKPRATNLTEAGRIRNRRIDFAVSDTR